jgi:hypothetical protein
MPAMGAPGTQGWFTEGNPGGSIPATVVTGDWLNDLVQNLKEISDRTGKTWTKGSKDDIANAIEALIARGVSGAISGEFRWVSASTVRLARALEGKLRIEIDGVLVQASADLDFTLPTHLESGSEAGGTFYYCYVFYSGGVLIPRISVTPPESNPALKVGYHPSNTTWRYVAAFRNDNGSDIYPFKAQQYRPGAFEVVLRKDRIVVQGLGTTRGHTTYQVIDLVNFLPATAKEVLIRWRAQLDDTLGAFAPGEEIGSTIIGDSGLIFGHQTAGGTRLQNALFWVPVDSLRRIGYGHYVPIEFGGGSVTASSALVVGWRE